MDDVRMAQTKRACNWTIRAMFMIEFLICMNFSSAVFYLFLRERDATIGGASFLEGFFGCCILVCEPASGYFSDRVGRKLTLILGYCFGILGFIVYASATGFSQFLVGEVLLSVYAGSLSGTTEAITLDTLKDLHTVDPTVNVDERLRRITERQGICGYAGQGIAALSSVFIASYSLCLTLWMTAGIVVLGLSIILTIREPNRHYTGQRIGTFRSLLKRVVVTPPLFWLIVFTATLTTTSQLLYWITQPYLESLKMPVQFYGPMQTTVMISGASVLLLGKRLSRRFHDRVLLAAIAFLALLSCMMIATCPVGLHGLLLLLMGRTTWGLLSSITNPLFARFVDDGLVATMFSVRSFVHQLFFGGMSLTYLQFAVDSDGLFPTLQRTAIGLGMCLVIGFICLSRHWHAIPEKIALQPA